MRVFTLLIFFLSAPIAQGGGTSLGNGGGLGEQRMVYAWQSLPRLLALCSYLDSCRSSLGAERLIDEFLVTIGQSYQDVSLHFVPTAQGHFPVDAVSGLPALVNAGTNPGDPIEVNTDRLMTAVNDTQVSYIRLDEGLFALLTALGRAAHMDPQPVAALGRGLQALCQSSVKTTDLGVFGRPEVTLVALGDQLTIGDESAIYSLAPLASAVCPGADETPESLDLGLLRWDQFNIPYDSGTSTQILRAQGEASWRCRRMGGQVRNVSARLILSFSMRVQTADAVAAGPAGSDWQLDTQDVLRFVDGSQQLNFVNIQED